MNIVKQFLLPIILFVLFVGCNGCIASTNQRENPRYIDSLSNVEHVLNSTVKLIQRNSNTNELDPLCSGFYIAADLIATAHHCVVVNTNIPIIPGMNLIIPIPMAVSQQVLFINYQEWRNAQLLGTQPRTQTARTILFDSRTDVAVLQISNNAPRSEHFFRLSTDNVHPGQRVYVMSNPGLSSFILSEGIISNVERKRDGSIFFIHATPPIWFGSSGSGLFNDRSEVIGITSAISSRQNYLGVYSPIRNVIRLLNSRN